jgi:hypothetical protein
VCAHQVRRFEFFHLVRSLIQLLIRCGEEVQSTDDCLY